LDRKDRYWIINNCPELANYLENYSLSMLSSSLKIAWDGEQYGVVDEGGKGKRRSNSTDEGSSLIK